MYIKTTVSNIQYDVTFVYQTHIKLILNISHIYQHITQ